MKRILAGIASNENDEKMAAYLDYLASIGLVSEVVNYHFFTAGYLVKELNRHAKGHGDELLRSIKTHIEKKLHSIYEHVPRVSYNVPVGMPLHKFKNLTIGGSSSIIALGKAPKRLSTLVKNVVRYAQGSSLIVPTEAAHSLKHILVPVDLSENSKKLMEEAISLRSAIGDETVRITCFHAFDVPNYNLYYTFGTEQMRYDYIKANYQNALDKFVDEFTNKGVKNIEKVLMEEAVSRPSRYILEFISNSDVDFVIMGSNNKGIFEAFLGSTAEKVITRNDKVPLLVFK